MRDVLAFLQSLLNKGRAYRSIGVFRSAISKFHNQVEGRPIGQHPDICRFMRGAFLKNPPSRELVPAWDVRIVLKFLKKTPFEPLTKCSLHALTFKLVFLVAITSARRCAEIQALGRGPGHLRFEKDGVRLRTVTGFLPKTATPSYLGQDIFLPSYKRDKSLCVVRCLKHYLKVTNALMARKKLQHNHLFVCYGHRTHGNPVSKRTISGWVVKVIKAAYAAAQKPLPGAVRAHSTRAQATSIAAFSRVPIQDILKAADWRHASTFLGHYGLDQAIPEAVFGTSILDTTKQ